MLPSELFANDASAHLDYALARPTAEALEILGTRLASPDWKKTCERWVSIAFLLVQRGAPFPSVRPLLGRLVNAVTASEIDDVRSCLRMLISQLQLPGNADDALLRQLVEWLRERALPGHAALVADVLGLLRSPPGDLYRLPAVSLPLIEWILENGSGELRSHRRGDGLPASAPDPNTPTPDVRERQTALLLHRILFTVHDERPELVNVVLAYIAHHQNIDLWPGGGSAPLGAWPVIETGLSRGASEALIVELMLTGPREVWNFSPLDSAQFPKSRTAILRAMIRGAFPTDLCKKLWGQALRLPPPDDLDVSFDLAAELDLATDQIHYFAHLDAPQTGEGGVKRWSYLVGREAIRIHSVSDQSGHLREKLGRMAACSLLTDSIGAAIEDIVARCGLYRQESL